MEEKDKKFTYTYSAGEQEEIKNIRQKYLPPEENKMEQLKMIASVFRNQTPVKADRGEQI